MGRDGNGNDNDKSVVHASGARSSGYRPRYDLIPKSGLLRLAKRFELGSTKYGDWNWQKGLNDTGFLTDRLNHAIDHLMDYANGDRKDDNLSAVAWGMFLLMEAEAQNADRTGSDGGDKTRQDRTRDVSERPKPGNGSAGRGVRGGGKGSSDNNPRATAKRGARDNSCEAQVRVGTSRGSGINVDSKSRRRKGTRCS